MIQSYDKFSRQNTKFGKMFTLWKIHIYSKMLSQNMSSIGEIIFNNRLQNISFKNSFIWKSGKDKKKTLESFCKVIQLAPIYVLVHVFLGFNMMFHTIYMFDIKKKSFIMWWFCFVFGIQSCGFLLCEYFTWEIICDFIFLMYGKFFIKIITFIE
jgi:hypothetical protein